MGHARALLAVEKPSLQLKLYNETLKKGLSVRQVEALAKQYNEKSEVETAETQQSANHLTTRDYDILKKHLSATFHTPVKFSCDAAGKGKITFPFQNEEELERLISIFDKLKAEDLQNLQ